MDDELCARLREAAADHRPDRARILARVERGIAVRDAPYTRPFARPASSWLRVVSASAAVAGVFAVGGYAVASVVQGGRPADRTVATSPSPERDGSGSPSPDPSRSRAWAPPTPSPGKTRTPDRTPSAATTRAPSPGTSAPSGPGGTAPRTEDGYLWADGSVDPGSNDYWAQSNVTFTNREPLTALTVELRVAQTGGVADTGSWRSRPVEDFDVSVAERDGYLVYRWTLKAGRSVPTGEHVFAGQFDHAEGGRDAGRDRYTIRTTAESSERASVWGDFARTSD